MNKRSQNIAKELVGKEFETYSCGKCIVVAYNSFKDVLVRFYEHPCIVKCSIGNLKMGIVRNPNKPSFYGLGYIGVGKYSSSDKVIYNHWSRMLVRTYGERQQNQFPTYKDVSVCKEWLCFQNFAEWCVNQEFFDAKDSKGRCYELDKDLLYKGNKVYSPETCCFVPHQLNKAIPFTDGVRGDKFVGIRQPKGSKKYVVEIYKGKMVNLGRFTDIERAKEVYKLEREAYVRSVVSKWEGKISKKLYETLMDYNLEFGNISSDKTL